MEKIKTRKKYEAALEELNGLIERISEYEKRIPGIHVDPIEAIKFRMDQMSLKQKHLVDCFGSISRVSEVLSGKRNLSLRNIRDLVKKLGISPWTLLGLKEGADSGKGE
jgi:HTH-type transcriptional regulator/antitoxin HigA